MRTCVLQSVTLVCIWTAASYGQSHFNAYLSGGSHVPAVLSLGKGEVSASLSGSSLAFSGAFEGLDGAVVAVTIEEGYAGRSGAVHYTMTPTLAAGGRDGTFAPGSNTFNMTGAQLTLLNERRLYVNVKTSAHASGELRGQILPEADEYFEAPMSGGQAIPTAPTAATGSVIVELTGNTVKIHGSFNDLFSSVNTGNEGGVHIHWTRFGDSGNTIRHVLQVVYDDATKKSGVIRAADNEFTINDFSKNLLRDRNWYADVHSLRWLLGEVRGQLFPMSQLYFQGRMQDWNVVPPVASGASVGILGELKDDTLTASGTFLPMTDTVTALHIHRGYAGENGPVEYNLTPTFLTSAKNHGFVLPLDNRFHLTPSQIEDLLDRRLYADIHTVAFPGGEVRANFVPAPNNAPGMASLILPADNELIVNSPDATPSLFVDWTSVSDPEDDRIDYLWQLSRGEDFTSAQIIYNVHTENSSTIGVPGAVLDSLLGSDGLATGATRTYYHRAVATDGSVHHRTFYDQRRIRITRGTGSGSSLAFNGKVYLQGPFSGLNMTVPQAFLTSLHAQAATQPYAGVEFDGSSLEYNGSESLPEGLNPIDWILLTFHSDASLTSEIWRQAVLVMPDGTIVNSDGTSPVTLPNLPYVSMWVTVRHRNHISLMSSTAVDFSSGTGSWDFTTGLGKAHSVDRPPMKLLSPNKYGMFAANIIHDRVINVADFGAWLVDTRLAASGYRRTDSNLDNIVTVGDFGLWLINTRAAASEQIPE